MTIADGRTSNRRPNVRDRLDTSLTNIRGATSIRNNPFFAPRLDLQPEAQIRRLGLVRPEAKPP